MASVNEVSLARGFRAQRAALSAIAQSRTFVKNPRLLALLTYLCERSFAGQADSIKEFTIATDVFGRAANFDQSQDAIVRVEMHRLRKKLAEFYASEGRQEPLEIVIESGSYLPQFARRQGEAVALGISEERQREVSGQVQHTPGRVPGKLGWMMAGLFGAALSTALIAMVLMRGTPGLDKRVRASSAGLEAIPVPPRIGAGGEGIHITAGSSGSNWRDHQGTLWGPDAFFSGGTSVAVPNQTVLRTRDALLFRHMRTGEFSYRIPLRPGFYELRLYFFDPSYSPGVALDGGENTRVFNVALNGAPLLSNFDIIADAGPNTADVRVFKDVQPASDGYLHLNFMGNQGAPLLNGIEIEPGTPHRLHRIRMVMQGSTITDREGGAWYPDDYFENGREIAHSTLVTGDEDQQIYGGERYGNFSYAIPVTPGKYRVTLYFAEAYWGSVGPGGTGTRVFNVFCNGNTLLRNFDMLRAAAPRTQIVKTFDNLQPNAQGKLVLTFQPVSNYATLSAIEVADESDASE